MGLFASRIDSKPPDGGDAELDASGSGAGDFAGR